MRSKLSRSLLLATIVASSIVVLAPPAFANDCDEAFITVAGQLSPGTTRSWGTFSDTNDDHVPDGWGANHEFQAVNCARTVSSSVFTQEIKFNAETAGDVNVDRWFTASPTQSYSATAFVNSWGHDGTDFRVQLKISAWNSSGCVRTGADNECWEKLASLCTNYVQSNCYAVDDGNYKTIAISNAVLPSNTASVKVSVRSKWRPVSADAYGVGGVDQVTFSRN